MMPDIAVRAMDGQDRRAIYRYLRSPGAADVPAPDALPPGKAPPPPYLGPGLRQAPTTRAEAFHPCRLGLGAGESVQFRYVFTRPSAMLRVTKLTDYATVVLTVMASRPGEVLSAAELAEHSGLEQPTVSKLLKPLAQAGLVEGLRGVRGGYRLARDADRITLIEIVEAMEGPLAMTECSQAGSNQCGIAHQCGVRTNWRLINDVVADALRGVTLAQMLHPLSPSVPTATRRREIAVQVAS